MPVLEAVPIVAALEDRKMPIAAHLVELRRRLITGLLIWGAGSALAFLYSARLLDFLARPVGSLVFTAPAEAFQTQVRLALYGGFLLSLPLLLHQLWLFTARALAPAWRRRLLVMVPLSYGLFLLGVGIAIYGVVPQAMRFFMSFGSEDVKPLIALSAYLGFVEKLSLGFGAVFQFPLALYILNWMGVVSKEQLKPHRRLIYFAAFVLPALFTPEIVGQISLAACLIALFELSLLAMRT